MAKKASKKQAKKTEIETSKNFLDPKILSKITSTLKKPFASRKRNIAIISVLLVLIIGYLAFKFLVFALVDNIPLTRMDLYKRLEKRDNNQTKDQIINEALILSEARKRNIAVSQKEIDEQIKKIEEQQGGESQLKQALQINNLTMEDLGNQVKLQIYIEKMFSKDIQITDTELADYMEKNKASLPEIKNQNSSEAAKLKVDIKDQLRRQKISQTFNTWLQDTIKSNRVVRL